MENRTVFDTNIWISYIITAKYDDLESMLTDNVHFLRSAPSLAELQEVLSRKKFLRRVNQLFPYGRNRYFFGRRT